MAAEPDNNTGPWIVVAVLTLFGGLWGFLRSIGKRGSEDEAGRKPTDFYMRIWDKMEGKHGEAMKSLDRIEKRIDEIDDRLADIRETLNRKG